MSTNLLSIGTSALAANMAALNVTGNNIANVNTPGYSRETVQLQSVAGQMSGNAYIGKGVDIAAVERAHSDFLTRQEIQTSSVAAADTARSGKLALVEPIFASGSNGVGASINATLNAFAGVVNTPTDLSARLSVLSNADEMAARLRDASTQLDQVGQGLNEELKAAVGEINLRAKQIASLNAQIAALQGSKQTPNDLLDKRDQLVKEVNQYVQASTVAAPDGSISVFVGGTQALVLGGQAMQMSTTPDTYDPSRLALAIQTPAGPATLNDGQLAGGSVAGLLQFQRTDLVDARNQLGRLALATGSLMNDQHHLGLDLKGVAGGDLFNLPALPAGLPARSNTGTATISLGVADATAFAASDYQLNFDASGVTVQRLSDGQTSHFAALPAQLDGLTLSVGSGAAAIGDSFLLKPFSAAAAGISVAIGSPGSLAVATPIKSAPGAANTGDLSVTSLQATQANANLGASVTFTFNGSGSFNVSGTGTGNPVNVPYVSGQPVQFNGWTLMMKGTPQAGDTLQVTANPSGTLNADQANGFLSLRDTAAFDGVSISNGYSTVLSEIGSRVQAAQLSSDVSQSMATQAAQSQASVSGVNLDEEAAKLLQYQQAYQASARILQIAQTVFTSLMQGIGA